MAVDTAWTQLREGEKKVNAATRPHSVTEGRKMSPERFQAGAHMGRHLSSGTPSQHLASVPRMAPHHRSRGRC